MVNRYAGEIHINPIRILRNNDFNNDGRIKDIDATLKDALAINQRIGESLRQLLKWLEEKKVPGVQFQFEDAGYISVKGLSDAQLQQLASKKMIELFDFATDKEWVKKHGRLFGLIWEDGRAVEIDS